MGLRSFSAEVLVAERALPRWLRSRINAAQPVLRLVRRTRTRNSMPPSSLPVRSPHGPAFPGRPSSATLALASAALAGASLCAPARVAARDGQFCRAAGKQPWSAPGRRRRAPRGRPGLGKAPGCPSRLAAGEVMQGPTLPTCEPAAAPPPPASQHRLCLTGQPVFT
jgi:hypothetical protein